VPLVESSFSTRHLTAFLQNPKQLWEEIKMNKSDTGFENGTPQESDFQGQITELEDGFDVDLMACGCRVQAPITQFKVSVRDLIRLYDLDQHGVVELLGAVIDEVDICADTLFELAERVSKNDLPASKKSA
jgi:hypothetical protein